MANYATLKAAIQQVIKTNGNNEITGSLLQQTLLTMVTSLGTDYLFAGIATTSTSPGTPDQNVFYIAGPGTYPNFNNATIADGQLGVFKYNGSWTTETVPVGKDYSADLDELKLRQIPMHVALPMIEKTSVLVTATQDSIQWTPELISRFVLDMKLEGSPQSGYSYEFGFQYKKTSTLAWANYLYLRKRPIGGGSPTTIGTLTLGATAPTGVHLYKLTLSETTYVTKCSVLLDYRVLENYVGGSSSYSEIHLYNYGYRFNNTYLFDNTDRSLIWQWSKAEKVSIDDILTPVISKSTSYPSYINGIKEIFISPKYLEYVDAAGVNLYNNVFYVSFSLNGTRLFRCTLDVPGLENNVVYNLLIESVESGFNGVTIGECIGFIIFKNISGISASGSAMSLDIKLLGSISAFSGRTDAFISPYIERNKGKIVELVSPGILPFTQFGLPGIKKGTLLPNVVHNTLGQDIPAAVFSQFFVDMKLVGTPEENTKYRFSYLQHRANTGGPSYSNYFVIAKSSDDWATMTQVAAVTVGAVAPTGMVLYEMTPTNSTLSKIRLLLNWGAIKDYNNSYTGANSYARYNIPKAYAFDMAYLTNQEYGIIPNIDAYRSIANIQTVVENIAEPIINDALNYGLEIQLPNVLYAVVGTEMNLWNDTIAYSMDKGLQSPMNYSVGWYCTVGTITNRCYRFTPEASHAGNTYNLTCYLYNGIGQQVATKTVQIKVKAQNALSQLKRIVYFGDSLGAETARYLYNDFNNSGKFTGTIPTMLGTKGTTYHYEAVGGYRWSDYATKGRRAFRCQVTNFSGTIGLNTNYTNNGFTWKVVEININNGTGNILITKEDTSGTDAPLTNGNLVSTGSYETIPYTDAQLEGANPLWNETTQQLDVALYRQRLGLGTDEKLDAVSFQFGINDSGLANDLPTLLSYIQALYNAFIADNANCLFIVGLTTTSGNDANGSGANYGATAPNIPYNHRVFLIRSFYLTLQGNADMPNLRVAPISPQIDRYYGYAFGTRQISQRYTENEQYHINYVHPGASGYGQLGDAYFAAYVGALTE